MTGSFFWGMGVILYTDQDKQRVFPVAPQDGSAEYRTEFRRDYARLIHSPCFRRLQGKTQLFPGSETDFFRNRLTHSFEVAQIAKTIAMKLNSEVEQLRGASRDQQLDYDLVELAALAHDLGHPPFGHNGERALDDCMKRYGGFEGNAQTLRILSRLEKKNDGQEFLAPADHDGKDQRIGLNLTFRSLAAILKYDHPIKRKRTLQADLEKGYYASEAVLVEQIKEHVANLSKSNDDRGEFRTIECWIMDCADDIAYSTYDFEDALKAGFMSPLRLLANLFNDRSLLERVVTKVNKALERLAVSAITNDDVMKVLRERFKKVLYAADDESSLPSVEATNTSQLIADNGYLRTQFTSQLVNTFVSGIRIDFRPDLPAISRVYLEPDVRKEVEIFKHLTYETIIMSPRLKIVEYRGYGVTKGIFDAINSDDGHLLLPDDFRGLYDKFPSTDDRSRVVCDFIAGMTDRYALEFHARIAESGPSIFKPF